MEDLQMEKISPEKLSKIVAERRNELGYTQEELGTKTDINRQIIGRIEKQKHIPSIHQLNRLMEELRFELDDITVEKNEHNVFLAMMGQAHTEQEKEWLEKMLSMMLCLRKHTRIRKAMSHEVTVKS